MKTLLTCFATLLMLSGCAVNKSQLVTLSSDNLKAQPDQGFVYDTDTLRLSYQFFSERGVIHLTVENKLAKPLYVDWKRSAFIIGQNKLDYWYDVAAVNLYGTAYTNTYSRYFRSWSGSNSTVDLNGNISKENSVDFIPPGTKLTKEQFVLVPGPALVLPGQYSTEKVASSDLYNKKPVDVQTYQYTPDTSPLKFRNYLTLSTDKDFKNEIVLDSKFWASGVKVMPQEQLTGGAYISSDVQNMGATTLKSIPYYRPDSFFINYTQQVQY
ncbi:MAG: hypothetical protein EOO39_15195 [Cytophagaceae bacterium]|nr:MAG: hypothetical protein EOO39_15195 [Cytophagaceae bacterium]